MIASRRAALWSCAVALAIAGCATETPKQDSTPTRPAAPRYNLAGYPPAFKAGYADACATPRRRNEQRFKDDTDYRIGWQDGSSVCRVR